MIYTKIVIGTVLVGAFLLSACTTTEPPKSVIESQTTMANAVAITSTVETVDEKNRVLALRDANGETRTMSVDPSVTSLDRIASGDRVTAVYLESMAVYIEAPGMVARDDSATSVPTVQRGAAVEAIDYAARVITLRMPDGSLRTLRVSPQIGPLDKIHEGDQVVVRYTQMVAVCVAKVE